MIRVVLVFELAKVATGVVDVELRLTTCIEAVDQFLEPRPTGDDDELFVGSHGALSDLPLSSEISEDRVSR